jgi:hypothetical protein
MDDIGCLFGLRIEVKLACRRLFKNLKNQTHKKTEKLKEREK